MVQKAIATFLLDESVTEQVHVMLNLCTSMGLEVVRSVERLAQGAEDRDVVNLGNSLGAIVVDANCKDFRKLISRRPPNNNFQQRSVGRVSLTCNPKLEAERMREALPIILWEWIRRQERTDKRVIIEVGDHSVCIYY